MRSLLLLACLLGVCLAGTMKRQPHQCKSPPLLTGGFTFSTQNEKAWFYAGYEYDAIQERIRVYETGTYMNQTFTYDALFLYKEKVMYQIDSKASTCTKQPLQADFMPMGVPPEASLVGQYVIGTSSGPGEGLLVDTWTGNTPEGAPYLVTVTEYGCVPVSTVYRTKEFGWVVLSYVNNIKGILDPSALNPPSFCPPLEAKPVGMPVDFFTVVNNLKKTVV